MKKGRGMRVETSRVARAMWKKRAVALVVSLVVAGSAMGSDRDQRSREAFRELQLGFVALNAEKFDSAVEHYSRARDLASGDEQLFNALFGIGAAASELGRLDTAREALSAAHELKPGEVGATFMLGVVCRRQGRLDDAVRFLAEAAVRDPELTQALVELGIAYGAIGRHADAEQVCRDVLNDEPDHIEARLGLAVALYHQDDLEPAAAEFRRVLAIEPTNVRARYGLGLALLYSRDRDGAMDELRYLKEHAPDLGDDLYSRLFPDG
jgi:tetratricopeptide (TPR) repeat protein